VNSLSRIPPSLAELPLDGNPLSYWVSTNSCSEPYFGLGDISKIDSIEVAWPSGRKQVIRKGLTDNQTLKITEPDK
jgi:hypothetical protein